jgi:beta-glucosidase
MVITENGMALADQLDPDGRVQDKRRQQYLKTHLSSLHRAISDGAPLTGYLIWSFIDNFEWSSGYRPRFGIVYNDYETQTRTVKDSGHMLADIIRSNGFPAGCR